MRVIAGTARSLPLRTPEGLDTRPTIDRIKETLFNVLQMDVPGSIFVDLFSGSGAIGIEALSRGARKAYFVPPHTRRLFFGGKISPRRLARTHQRSRTACSQSAGSYRRSQTVCSRCARAVRICYKGISRNAGKDCRAGRHSVSGETFAVWGLRDLREREAGLFQPQGGAGNWGGVFPLWLCFDAALMPV